MISCNYNNPENYSSSVGIYFVWPWLHYQATLRPMSSRCTPGWTPPWRSWRAWLRRWTLSPDVAAPTLTLPSFTQTLDRDPGLILSSLCLCNAPDIPIHITQVQHEGHWNNCCWAEGIALGAYFSTSCFAGYFSPKSCCRSVPALRFRRLRYRFFFTTAFF